MARLDGDDWAAVTEEHQHACREYFGDTPLEPAREAELVLGALLDLRDDVANLEDQVDQLAQSGKVNHRVAAMRAAREHVNVMLELKKPSNNSYLLYEGVTAQARLDMEMKVAAFLLGEGR